MKIKLGVSRSYAKSTATLLLLVFLVLEMFFASYVIQPTRGQDSNTYDQSNGGSAVWPMFRYNSEHTARSPYVGAQQAALKWAFTAGGEIHSSPAIGSDGTIYVGCNDGKLYAINPAGSLKWSYLTGAQIQSSPSIGADGTIYVGSYDSKFYAIHPNGTLYWSYQTVSHIYSSPAIDPLSGMIYVAAGYDGAWHGRMYSFYPNGTLNWAFNPGTGGSWIYASPAIRSDGVILFGDFTNPNSIFWALNPNGTILWSTVIPNSNGENDLVSSAAVGFDGKIYFGENSYGNRRLISLHPNGTIAWTYLTNGIISSSPAIASDGTIYVGSSDGNLYAINNDGSLNWTYSTGAPVYSSPIIGADGTIYLGANGGGLSPSPSGLPPPIPPPTFFAINSDGSLKWNFTTLGVIDSSPAISNDGTTYAGSADGKLYAFQTSLTNSTLNETHSLETSSVQKIAINMTKLTNATISGDLEGLLNFTSLELANMTTGSFTGNGFSKGIYSTTLEGIQYSGTWQGTLTNEPEKNQTLLRGTVAGQLQGIVEASLSESIPGSNIYDKYQALWTISHLGLSVVYAKLNLNGTIDYQTSQEYSSSFYILQTSLQGQASGYYEGPLDTVITHVRINDTSNPANGEGFSIISYTTNFGSGEGWTQDHQLSQKTTGLTGFFSDPLIGIVSGTLNEDELGRTLNFLIERIKIGLTPQAELRVKVWGPERVSPGQRTSFALECRNDGLKPVDDAVVFFSLDPANRLVSASSNGSYDEINHLISWDLGTLSQTTTETLTAQVEVQWGLASGTSLNNYAYIIKADVDDAFEALDSNANLGANGINHNRGKQPSSCKKWDEFSNVIDASEVPNLYASGSGWQDVIDVQKATPQKILGYEDGQPIVGYDEYGAPDFALPGYQIVPNMLGSGDDFLVYPNENNGLTYFSDAGPISVDTAFGYSGGTRTLLTAVLSGKLNCRRLVLISPMSGASEWGHWKQEIEAVVEKGVEVVIYQSAKDRAADPVAGKLYDWLYQVKLSKSDIPWLRENGIKVNPGTEEFAWDQDGDGKVDQFPPLEINGKSIRIDENEINTKSHGGLFGYINSQLQNEPGTSASTTSVITIARDPNIKLGIEGYIQADQLLDYTVEFENEGEGIAYGVYFSDTLCANLNDSTLQIDSVRSTINGAIIAPSGTYNPLTRTITWFVGEVGPNEGGYGNFSIKANSDLLEYNEIINYATVFFPSVPETTRTNPVVSVVGRPNVAISNIAGGIIQPDGANQTLTLSLSNKGYYPETLNITLRANSTFLLTQNITLTGKTNDTATFLWDRSLFSSGNYSISAFVLPVIGEVETGDNSYQTTLFNSYIQNNDSTPPTTSLVIGEPKFVSTSIYITKETLLSLQASDSGSGVQSTVYRLNNASYDSGWINYTLPFKLTLAPGTYTIRYNSTDNAGNVETTKQQTLVLIQWGYNFQDFRNRRITISVDIQTGLFQIKTSAKDFGIRNATNLVAVDCSIGNGILLNHKDNELQLTALIVGSIDCCNAQITDKLTGTQYKLIDRIGFE